MFVFTIVHSSLETTCRGPGAGRSSGRERRRGGRLSSGLPPLLLLPAAESVGAASGCGGEGREGWLPLTATPKGDGESSPS